MIDNDNSRWQRKDNVGKQQKRTMTMTQPSWFLVVGVFIALCKLMGLEAIRAAREENAADDVSFSHQDHICLKLFRLELQ